MSFKIRNNGDCSFFIDLNLKNNESLNKNVEN